MRYIVQVVLEPRAPLDRIAATVANFVQNFSLKTSNRSRILASDLIGLLTLIDRFIYLLKILNSTLSKKQNIGNSFLKVNHVSLLNFESTISITLIYIQYI